MDLITARTEYAKLRKSCVKARLVTDAREFDSACRTNGAYVGAPAATWLAAARWFVANARMEVI